MLGFFSNKHRSAVKKKKRPKIIFSKYFFRGLVIMILLGLFILIYLLIYYFSCSFYSAPSSSPKFLTSTASSTPPSPSPSSAPDSSSIINVSENTNPPVMTGTVNLSRNPDLTFGVYFDDFPNSVYIDKQRTSLYWDETATAIFFPPVYDWREADSSLYAQGDNYFSNLALNYFAGPYNDRRCLGNNCLEQKGDNLYYNGQILAWPPALNSADIVAVSISALTERWLVGVTLKEGGNYRGRVYYFDGRQLTEIKTPAPLTSLYFGVWGFGGEESDFLMIYGAYDGIAYRVRGDRLTNISEFFAIRAMNQGFKAEVLKVGQGLNTTWYVYSSTMNRPRLIKLWQNRSSEIVGEAFFPNLAEGSALSTAQSATFKFLSSDTAGINLLAEIKNQDGSSARKVFRDRGFDNSSAASLVTIPISNDGANSEIIIRKIAQAKLGLDAGSKTFVKYLFSADCQTWRDLPSEKNVDFITPALQHFCLKVVFDGAGFEGGGAKFYSPYLSSMMFNYYRAGSGK